MKLTLFILEKKLKLNTQWLNQSKTIKFLINTLYIPHCSVFNQMQQDFHMHSQYVKNSQEYDF